LLAYIMYFIVTVIIRFVQRAANLAAASRLVVGLVLDGRHAIQDESKRLETVEETEKLNECKLLPNTSKQPRLIWDIKCLYLYKASI